MCGHRKPHSGLIYALQLTEVIHEGLHSNTVKLAQELGEAAQLLPDRKEEKDMH